KWPPDWPTSGPQAAAGTEGVEDFLEQAAFGFEPVLWLAATAGQPKSNEVFELLYSPHIS
ncbi:MAG: hypothetical protein L0312_28350, partial [Acidobacteria bacterium]|nr:hypothetical protein [Acidobacteriota bacterium]